MKITRKTCNFNYLGFRHDHEQTFEWEDNVWLIALDRKRARNKNSADLIIIDEPGTYSVTYKNGYVHYKYEVSETISSSNTSK